MPAATIDNSKRASNTRAELSVIIFLLTMHDNGCLALQRGFMGGHGLVELGDGSSGGVDICFADIGDLCSKPIVILGDVIGVNFTSRVCHTQSDYAFILIIADFSITLIACSSLTRRVMPGRVTCSRSAISLTLGGCSVRSRYSI